MDGVDSRKKVMQNEECIDFSKFMKDEVDNGDKGEFDTLMEKISKELNPKQLVFTDETDSEEKWRSFSYESPSHMNSTDLTF